MDHRRMSWIGARGGGSAVRGRVGTGGGGYLDICTRSKMGGLSQRQNREDKNVFQAIDMAGVEQRSIGYDRGKLRNMFLRSHASSRRSPAPPALRFQPPTRQPAAPAGHARRVAVAFL